VITKSAVPQPDVQLAPTAQAVPPGPADTALRIAPLLVRGVGTADHADPFHRKMSARPARNGSPQSKAQLKPTAQAVPPGPTVMAAKVALSPGLGLGTRDHARPVQRKISVRNVGAARSQL
jgi:hypothetical protein